MLNDDFAREVYSQISKREYLNNEESRIEVRSETIGKILKYLRKRVGLTQTTVANTIGIAQQTYAGYENGKHEPSIEIMIRLANLYGLSMDYITGRFIGEYGAQEEQEYEAEIILREVADYYASIEENNKKYIKMIRENAKKKD